MMVPDGFSERLVTEIIALNRMYRDEFRQGIGDEVAVFGDFLGEVPAIPGIPQEVIRDQTVPRFLIARPLVDRTMVTAAGKSMEQSVRRVSAWLGESVGISVPAILPQSIESGGMVTWYPPVPFIGGDFVPGVSIDERVWMLGSSRSLARGFSKAMETAASAGETGVIFEVNLERLVAWTGELSRANADRIGAIMEGIQEDSAGVDAIIGEDGIPEAFRRLGKFSYRGWLDGGQPRGHYRLGFLKRP